MRSKRQLQQMWDKDPNMRELIDSLWREYYALYNERYQRIADLDELGEPIDRWLRNKISSDINFGQALGQDHLIEGNRSAAFGQGGVTKSFMEIVLGAYNLIPEGQNAEEWIPTDLLLTLGNGPDEDHRSNVFEIFKNGLIRFLQAIVIGAHPELPEGQTPGDGAVQFLVNALSLYFSGAWHTIALNENVPDIIITEINNQTSNLYQSFNQVINNHTGTAHESHLIENTTNASETVVSSWTVIPYNEQVGEFKAVVMVRNKATDTIITLIALLSFDYSETPNVVLQSNLITDAALTLTVGVNIDNKLYATIAGMPVDAKRIHFCFERCVLSQRIRELSAHFNFELNMEAEASVYKDVAADFAFDLDMEAGASVYKDVAADFTFDLDMSADVTAEHWDLLLEFQTNSPGSTTFDPAIVASSGEYKWDVGGVEFFGTSLSTTLDGTTKTVKLYGKGTCAITALDFQSDNIVGDLDIRNSAFSTITSVTLPNNPLITNVLNPAICTGVMNYWNTQACTGLTGTLDLSMFTTLGTGTQWFITSTAGAYSLTGVTLPTSYTGVMYRLELLYSGVTSLDLSNLTKFSNGAILKIEYNNSLATVVTPSIPMTGAFALLSFRNNIALSNSSGDLDLTGYDKFTTTGGVIDLAQANGSVTPFTSVTFSPTITGKILVFQISDCAVTSLDLTMFTSFATAGSGINIQRLNSCSSITFAASITGSFSSFIINTITAFTGALDISMFTSFSTSSVLSLVNITASSITLPASPTGTFRTFQFAQLSVTSLNVSMFTSFTSAAYYYVQSCTSLTSLTLPVSVTGTFNLLYIMYTALTGTLDVSMFTTFGIAADLEITANSGVTAITTAGSITGTFRYFYVHSNAAYISPTPFSTIANVNSSNIWVYSNGWTAAQMNQFLYELNSITGSGYTSRVVLAAGTNASPDSSSGGYDGLAEKASLESKGFTVTTN